MYYTHPHPSHGATAYAVPPYQPQGYPARPQPQPTATPQAAAGAYWMPPNAAYNPSPYQSPHHSPSAYQANPATPGGAYPGIPKPSARTHRASFAYYTTPAQPNWDGQQQYATPPRPTHSHTHPHPGVHPTAHPGGHIPTAVPTGVHPSTGVPPPSTEYHHPPPPKPRTRRASYAYPAEGGHRTPRHSYGESHAHIPPQVPPEPEKHNKATEEDCVRAKIPKGFSTENWNPSEEPLIVLGSVFDPYHLGKWIFDWCVYRFGARSRETELASRLWFSLISVSSNYKKAMRVKDCKIQTTEARTMGEFRESANRLWARLKGLVKDCERAMWNAASADTPKGQTPELGSESGVAFVDTMFGEGNRRDMTVQLLQSMSLWEFRFHANCDEIIRASRKK